MSQEPAVDIPPRETQTSSGNKIIELDPNDTSDADAIPKKIDNPKYDHDELSELCDQLLEIGADGQSALLEIERRHLADNPDHTLRFTAKELTSIAISLSIAYTVNFYRDNRERNEPIIRFGSLIYRQTDAPMDGTHGLDELEGMAPFSDPTEDVDPFRVIRNDQKLAFTTEEGVPIPPKDDILIDYPDE